MCDRHRSSRGLGQAIAVKLAEAGADVALCDLHSDGLKRQRLKFEQQAVGLKFIV